jgi:nucleotide-binding universal stress UspA family protein
MFRILVATDGSEAAKHAAAMAARLAQNMPEAEVVALYVRNTAVLTMDFAEAGGGGALDVSELQRELDIAAEQGLNNAAEAMAPFGVTPSLRSEWGRPSDVICNIAEQENFDLTVVGSSGMGQVAGIFLGSVSDRVVHRARTPVLVVR